VDYCSTVAGASLVAHPYPESSKIGAWAIPSGWSAIRKVVPTGAQGIIGTANWRQTMRIRPIGRLHP
jgi:hypothetical protein